MKRKALLPAVFFTGLFLAGLMAAAVWSLGRSGERSEPQSRAARTEEEPPLEWRDEGVRIAGNYADADVIETAEGLRMYYSIEPEVPGNRLEMFSARSTDGLNWEIEPGVRMTERTFPEVVETEDRRYRLYYQTSAGPGELAIGSSISQDGLAFTDEPGVRIPTSFNLGYDEENVAAPSVVQLENGTYLMVYRGSSGENRFGQKDFDGELKANDHLLSATSKDGLTWDPGRLIVDSDDDQLRGQVDGPELFLDGEVLRLFYWSFPGVFVKESEDGGRTWSDPVKIYASTGPDDAPGDPTVIEYEGVLRLYYGLHTKGIHSARLR